MKKIKTALTLLCMMLCFGINGWAAPSVKEIVGAYLISASLGSSGEMENVDCHISQGTGSDRVNIEFTISIPTLAIVGSVDVKASARYSDGILTLYNNEIEIANASMQGLSISLGHRPSPGANPTAADAISAELKESDFIFDPDDCLILSYATLYSIVASNLIISRIDEEKPTCRFVGSIPANGAVVDAISEITTFWHRIDDRVVVNSLPIPLYDGKNNQVSTGRIVNTSDTTCIITISPKITSPGNYRLVIPEGIVSTRNKEPLNSEVSLYLNITDENFIPNIEALPDDYSLSFVMEPNGTWSNVSTSIELTENPDELIVNFPIVLAGQQCNLAIPSVYKNGILSMTHKESDLISSPIGDLAIGFYHWTDGHTNTKYVEQISANWNGAGFSFDPDDCISVKSAGIQVLFADNLILTKVNETVYKCSKVSFDYDGRYLAIEGNGLWDTIYYTFDTETNPANGIQYVKPFDIGGINSKVRAVAMKDGYLPSEISEFTPNAYGIDGEAWVKENETLQYAYLWLPNELKDGWPSLTVHGFIDENSYGFIEQLTELRHLDLSDAVSPNIPNFALKSTGIISISLPKGIQSIGSNVLTDNKNLSALIWNTESDVSKEMAANLNASLNGQGVLFYIDGFDYLDDNNSLSVIKDGVANNPIVLKESNSWYCPRDFLAKNISYVKKFSKKTAIDGCSGWETIALPFDVESISFGSEPLYPFGDAEGNDLSKRFWLYQADNGWQTATGFQAYTPYLIAMPNNEAYYQPYNIVGDVTFSATDITVGASPEDIGYTLSSKLSFHTNFLNHDDEGPDNNPIADGMMIVNNTYSDGSEPGSIFVLGEGTPKPFEAYASGSGINRIPIMDTSLATDQVTDLSTRIWNEGKSIFILSPIRAEVPVYDLSGRCIALKTVLPNEVCRIDGLSSGIYLIANKKIMIRK